MMIIVFRVIVWLKIGKVNIISAHILCLFSNVKWVTYAKVIDQLMLHKIKMLIVLDPSTYIHCIQKALRMVQLFGRLQ